MTEAERAERRRETLRRYNNKPERKARLRHWLEENRERHQANGQLWRENNREIDRASHRQGYERNKAVRQERSRKAYHRDKLLPEKIVKGLFNGAARRAREKVLPFTLTKEWVLERVLAGRCEVSGLPFKTGNGIYGPFSPSIDKIDNALGYTHANCRLVIWAVNNLKGVGSDETMFAVATAIIENYKRKE